MLLSGLAGLFFYFSSFLLLVSAGMVVWARNPIHSILFLIVCFFNGAVLFLLTGAEFLAMLLLIIYVGAIAIVFLFVVMMIDLEIVKRHKILAGYRSLGLLVGGLIFVDLLIVFSQFGSSKIEPVLAAPQPEIETMTNTRALGDILYTNFIFYFEIIPFILLVAMIGAIVLTLHQRPFVKRQSVSKQTARRPEETLEIKKVAFHKGLEE